MRFTVTRFILALACSAALIAGPASAQPTTVSYQGELSVGGIFYTGVADFKFVIITE